MPIRFCATPEDASLVSEALRLGFEEHYLVRNLLVPALLFPSFEADRLRKVVNNNVAKRFLLVYWWQVPAAVGRPPMVQSAALKLMGETPRSGPAHGSGQRIPVYKVREGRRPEANEPLNLCVVEPRFTLSHILIEINEDSWAASGTLRILEEGKWIPAGVKDYMYRIDRGHSRPRSETCAHLP